MPPDAPAVEVEPLLLDARQAARALGIGCTLFYSLQSRGQLPRPVRLGRRTLWRLDELRAWTTAGCPPRDRWQWPPEREGGTHDRH